MTRLHFDLKYDTLKYQVRKSNLVERSKMKKLMTILKNSVTFYSIGGLGFLIRSRFLLKYEIMDNNDLTFSE